MCVARVTGDGRVRLQDSALRALHEPRAAEELAVDVKVGQENPWQPEDDEEST